MKSYKEEQSMESLQLKDNELEQLINAINGTPAPTGEVNNLVEKIKRSDDSTVAFNALNAGMNVKKVGCPIFFVPTDHGSNALANIVEPFKKVAIPTAQEMYTIIKNDTAVYNYCHILAGQTIALMDSNIDIIFQDGFLKVLRTFSKDPNTLICLYNDGKANLGIETFVLDKLSNMYHSLVEANMNKDLDRIKNSFMVNLVDFKGYIADVCCAFAYYMVNNIMNDVYTDIDGLAGYFEAEGVNAFNDLGERSKHSMCTQCSAMLFNADIAKIVEIAELTFVGFFYNVDDIIHQAVKDGVEFAGYRCNE